MMKLLERRSKVCILIGFFYSIFLENEILIIYNFFKEYDWEAEHEKLVNIIGSKSEASKDDIEQSLEVSHTISFILDFFPLHSFGDLLFFI